ncbi:MAG TPA: hypothetical protein VLV56_17345 [Burkholderiales bacterium]|nr:hypothetical protein [Burkholderiales bacterium]
MKRSSKIAIGVAAALGLGAAVAVFAHPGGMGPGMMGPGMGPGMGGPMGHMQGDASFADDMRLVHAMLFDHDKIKRSVSNLPDGIRTVTESDDPGVARAIKAHVASMEKRLSDGKIFNLFSPTLPVLFENRDTIKTAVEMTDKGSIVTQTSGDAKTVAALQAHAVEVSELARDGMSAMMRAARASRGQAAFEPEHR